MTNFLPRRPQNIPAGSGTRKQGWRNRHCIRGALKHWCCRQSQHGCFSLLHRTKLCLLSSQPSDLLWSLARGYPKQINCWLSASSSPTAVLMLQPKFYPLPQLSITSSFLSNPHICEIQSERSGYMGTVCKNVFSEANTLAVFSGSHMLGCLWVARHILASRFCIWSFFPLVHT